MVVKYSCRSKIRQSFGKIRCAEISPEFPTNRSTQTCTDRATLIEHFFLTGEYLHSAGLAEYQFPDGVDDGSEIDITRLQNIQAPELSQLAHDLNVSLDKRSSVVVDSIKETKRNQLSSNDTVVNTKGDVKNE